jgi:hypothetical protein
MTFGEWHATGQPVSVMRKPPPGRVGKNQAMYRRGYPLRSCGTCSMYWHREHEKQFGGCTKVEGDITPYGICDFFRQLDNPYGNHVSREDRHRMERFYDEARGGR